MKIPFEYTPVRLICVFILLICGNVTLAASGPKEEAVTQLKTLIDSNRVKGIDTLPAVPEPLPQVSASPSKPEINAEIELQSGLYAADTGVSKSEAAKRLKGQERLSKVISLLEDIHADRFAGAWVEHLPVYRVVVRLTGNTSVARWMKNMKINDTVPVHFILNARATQRELLDTIDRNLPELKTTIPELSGTDVDVKTGEIILTVGTESVSAKSLEAVRGLLGKSKSTNMKQLLSFPLRVDHVDAPVSDGHTRGGANISSCTTGFVVKDSNNVRGFITAGHCGNNQTYSEFGGVSYGTNFIDEIRDSNQDVQWHTTPHLEFPHFYASSSSSYRTLTSRTLRSSQSVGGYVCHRGKTTGYSCGYIDSKTFKPTYTNACNGVTCSSVWVKVSGPSLKCFPGDSGGPWFLVYSAYGIYKGQSSSGSTTSGCNWAFYMASDYFGISLVY